MATGKIDKPKVHASLASLDVEADPEAFVYATKTGKRITFPDPGAMDADEADKFMGSFTPRMTDGEVLDLWLPKDEREALRAEKLTARQRKALLVAVFEHYKDIFGDQGEDGASSDS